MRSRSKLLLTALTAALVMAATVGTASARNLELAEVQDQRSTATWTPLEATGLGGLIRMRCNVTLRGSFHYRTIAKTRSLIGYITSAALTRTCTGGEAFILNGTERLPNGTTTTNTLPWHITYDSFTGTLPRITGLRLAAIGASYLLIALGNECLYRSTSTEPAFGIINVTTATSVASSLSADGNSSIPLSATLSGSCPASVRFAGTTSSLTDGAGGTIVIRLI
jgi:hypothetical protein